MKQRTIDLVPPTSDGFYLDAILCGHNSLVSWATLEHPLQLTNYDGNIYQLWWDHKQIRIRKLKV